jgi:heptosyltransferase-2
LKHKYEVKRLLGIVEEIGIINDGLDYGLEDLKKVKIKNEPLEIAMAARERMLVIAPGGNRITNRWPSVRFEGIAKRWVDDGGYVVIIGGGQDFTLAEEIIKSIPVGAAKNLCGITTLVESLELLRVCKIFLSNDSGPIHLAAAFKVPMVAIFSARDFPGKWFPIHEKSSILRISTNCSPCYLEVCNRNNLCLSSISVDDVWNAMKRVESIR